MELPFTPGTTANLTVTASSASVQLPAGGQQMRIVNVGTQVVYIKLGDPNVTAALTDMAILPNTVEIYTVARALTSQAGGHTHIAAIAASTGSALNITSGAGA